ncbi:hypothetical protein GCM10023116_33260 [Kistimonas scapharcae]|uniref:Uncharacterized protein n=1 Tax=Kistimonas scapharcae TaxID=1036133 RepID=A0ABP8V485_9GAMM
MNITTSLSILSLCLITIQASNGHRMIIGHSSIDQKMSSSPTNIPTSEAVSYQQITSEALKNIHLGSFKTQPDNPEYILITGYTFIENEQLKTIKHSITVNKTNVFKHVSLNQSEPSQHDNLLNSQTTPLQGNHKVAER